MTLSLAKRVASGVPRSKLFLQVLRRAAILYCLGLFLYGFPDFDLHTLRLLGVLQRIAICYAIASAIYLTTSIRGQIVWIVGLLVSYWMLMTLVPVPGYGPGRLDVEGNLAHYVDRLVLGAHNYDETKTWDPEGVVSTLPAIATALFGVMAGHILRLRRDLAERTTWLFVAGTLLLAARPDLRPLDADQQEAVDQLLLAVHGRPGLPDVRDRRLAGGRPRLAAAGAAARGPRDERDRGLHGVGDGRGIAVTFHWREPLYRTVFAPLLASPYNDSLLYALALLG